MAKITSVTSSIKSVFQNLKRLLSLIWKEDRKLVLGYYGTAGLGAFFPIITSYIYKLLVDNLIRSQNITASIPVILIAVLGSQYLISIAQDFVMWGLKNTYFDFLFRYKIQNLLNYKFFKKTSTLDIAHLENPKTEDLITKAEDTFTWRPPDFLRQFSYLFTNFISYISVFLLLLPYGFWIPIILTFITLPRLYLRAKYGKLQWSIYGSGAPEVRRLWYLRWLLSDRMAVTETRIFRSHRSLLKKFSGIQQYLYALNKKPVEDFLKVLAIPQVAEVLAAGAFAYLRLPQVLSGGMTIGDYTFFISLLARITDSAAGVVLNFGEMYENNLYVDHFFEVLNLPKIIKEPVRTKDLGNSLQPPKIEFKNVSFKYPGSENLVLKNINFTIEPGKNIAIVGHNGAGKTTIVKLLCRFYDVTSGEILINGINLKDVKLSHWYRFLGTLFQEFMHYDFTVEENIMLGNPDLKDRELLKKAAKESGAAEFIEKLPKKYKQLLGRQFEGGVQLSQGQWQKLAIARAFYEGAPILILDEPTSAIDAEAEYEIFRNLNKYYKNKTLLLISHRFSTVRNADNIIVLDEGKIVEEGSHEMLLSNNDIYARMFNRQAEGYQ